MYFTQFVWTLIEDNYFKFAFKSFSYITYNVYVIVKVTEHICQVPKAKYLQMSKIFPHLMDAFMKIVPSHRIQYY